MFKMGKKKNPQEFEYFIYYLEIGEIEIHEEITRKVEHGFL